MRARDLVRPHPVVSAHASAMDAVRSAATTSVRSVLVIDAAGAIVGVLSSTDLLRAIVPPFVEESPSIARALRSDENDPLRLHGRRKRVSQLLAAGSADAVVAADAALVEVMSVMVRTRIPLVGVVEDGRLLGGVTVDQLLDQLAS
jgi:CBS domain-containing protein